MNRSSYDDAPQSCQTRRTRSLRRIFDLPSARAVLPLLRRIAADLAQAHAERAHWERKLERLSSSSDWKEREARMRTLDDLQALAGRLRLLVEELSRLDAILLDGPRGILALPTIINGSLAYFIFRLEDDDLRYWRYRDQGKLRVIPTCWRLGPSAVSVENEGLLV